MTRASAEEWEGRRASDWAEEWQIPHLEFFDSLSSTNDRLRALADRGAAAFTCVIAEEQTAGRGRQGRGWSSPPGKGLWISILLRGPSSDSLRLSPLLLGIATARAVEDVAPSLAIGIKWPNDLIGHRRARRSVTSDTVRIPNGPPSGKVAGILCEAAGTSMVVAGIGINVRQRAEDFPPGLSRREAAAEVSEPVNRASPPVSLEMLAGAPVDRGRLASALVREVRDLLQAGFDAGRSSSVLTGSIAAELARRDILAGRRVWLSIPLGGERGGEGGGEHEGFADGIDPDGALRVLDREGRRHAVISGSVRAIS